MTKNFEVYYAIGLMSGSSLDGLDIAYCSFTKMETWQFEILCAETCDLGSWKETLAKRKNYSIEEIEGLSKTFAKFLAEQVQGFINKFKIDRLDLVASHGHTLYHYPEEARTCQLGNGARLSELLQQTVVSNLRQKDMDYGGQGAPIVPIGDLLLFPDYKFCLNLGGIANISFKEQNSIKAYDICPANQVLNYFAKKRNLAFDEGGELARKGHVSMKVLEQLNSLDFYSIQGPKSLDNSFSENAIFILEENKLSVEDALATYSEHIAYQINESVKALLKNTENQNKEKMRILLSGGGAFNSFLIERIGERSMAKLVLASENLINFKEALVMAFIGVLRIRGEDNVLASVTGARQNSSCGDIYYLKDRN
ncbi:MAG: anhydro-N-acetylmuramic acid kinase [Chitinophagales bacterium]|nr:anhydro-N-acetylmuramic acid kinase [Chitinophagales bacterium]